MDPRPEPPPSPSSAGRPWAALGVKHAWRRRDGRPLEGRIEEAGEASLLFAGAGRWIAYIDTTRK